MLLIEMQYLAPVSYYAEFIKHKNVLIEACEHFEKSTYRNRCYISGPNGKLRLSIPIVGGKGQRIPYAQVKMSHEIPWLKNHWHSLCSCYRNAPYFEYYEDRFAALFTHKTETLFEWNRQLMLLAIELLELDVQISYTQQYEKQYPQDVADFRSKILPGEGALHAYESYPVKYRQVFEDRVGFFYNLSIADLLFNAGPRGKELLAEAARGKAEN